MAKQIHIEQFFKNPYGGNKTLLPLISLLIIFSLTLAMTTGTSSLIFADNKPTLTTQPARKTNAKKHATSKPTSPESNLDYWLGQAEPVNPAIAKPTSSRETPLNDPQGGFRRDDALPGVIEFSDGVQLAGGIFTTRGKPIKIWLEKEKRWVGIPTGAVLSISAVVIQEEMKLRWRWKAMGEPEKVYTGKSYPFRRFQWKLHLADDSTIQGAIKGQPIWIEILSKTRGPFILHERAKGEIGQTLKDHVYIKKIVISRKMMNKVQQAKKDN